MTLAHTQQAIHGIAIGSITRRTTKNAHDTIQQTAVRPSVSQAALNTKYTWYRFTLYFEISID